jgi:ubiquinone/menaquinone biosynthesis C-methylase UbiE
VRELYEDVWEALPEDLAPPALDVRRAFLLQRVGAGDRVLDVGCGDGRFCAELAQAGARPLGIDVAGRAIRRARERHPELDFEVVEPHGPWPLDDASFDAVWASEVIGHVADTARWLSEVRRVLKPRGRLLVTTPDHGLLRRAIALVRFESHFPPLGQHLRFYTRRSLRALLEEFGFGDVRMSAGGRWPAARATLLAEARRRRF